MSTTPQFEIPVDMRKMTEQTLEQVRAAIHSYLQFFPRAVPGGVMGGSELTNKVLGYAERNVTSAFEFAQRLVQVRDIPGLMSLQAEFIQAQMQAMTEQAKDLAEPATKALTEVANTTITFESPDDGHAYQIFVVPYAESTITPERFRTDDPSGVMILINP